MPLKDRAYIVNRDSSNVVVIDLNRLEIMGNLETCGRTNHMGELSSDFSKLYVDSSDSNETVVLNAQAPSQNPGRLLTGKHPAHLSLSRDGKLLAIMLEGENAVAFVDPSSDTIIKKLPGFYTPHFMRFAPDLKYGYVANKSAHHITRVALDSLTIEATIPLEGFDDHTDAPDEGGFADAQIDQNGVLFAAHANTGRVLTYDTNAKAKLPELTVGPQPWIVYAEHPFRGIDRHVVPNFGDQTVSLIARTPMQVAAAVSGADKESYGVNYSPLAPDRAFVMNRFKNEIAVVNTATGRRVSAIPVGGTTETASTTADGKYILATVSSANSVVVIDAASSTVIKTFSNVGQYPWSVTIPLGQNYCH